LEADALRPKSSYSGNLYSVEYFKLLKSRLKKGGLAITWGATSRIRNGFAEVFPYIYEIDSFMIIGTDQALDFNQKKIFERLENSFTENHYRRAGIKVRENLEKALSKLVVLQNGTTKVSKSVNSDMWPKDEFDYGKLWEKILGKED
jgi:spermidine synthase